jgi:hypothetical protein
MKNGHGWAFAARVGKQSPSVTGNSSHRCTGRALCRCLQLVAEIVEPEAVNDARNEQRDDLTPVAEFTGVNGEMMFAQQLGHQVRWNEPNA